MPSPAEILDTAFQRALAHISEPLVQNTDIARRVEAVCRNVQNRAGVRLILACSLAKIHNPGIDIRKPYTEIGDADSYSGRTYDEHYVTPFITQYGLPCNPTTAFLTPALRNRNIVLTPDLDLVGRPPELYQNVLQLLADVHQNRISAEDLLAETIRCLLILRNEQRQRLESLLRNLRTVKSQSALSAEAIVKLVQQHLDCPKSSRLPVLVIAAAYKAAEKHLGERVLPLQAHTSADEQTGVLGDLEITLIDDNQVITSYEMKTRRIMRDDIDRALQKIESTGKIINNYVFITTDVITDEAKAYAASIYEQTGGIEVVVLDCIGFLRHFLHLFHRLRKQFLEAYQELVLAEPESAVSHSLKEAFLALRLAAESA